MSSGPTNILIRVGAETAGAVRDLGKVNSSLGDTMTTTQKASAGVKKAALPAAAALGAIGFAAIDATKAALEDAAAQDKLANQLKRTTGATDAQVKAAEDFITKTSLQVGVADDELRPALGKLATATGDVTKAQDELQLALDISAQTGKSLDTVTTALAKAHSGSTTALGKLVPGLDKATLATKDMTKITGELSDLTKGAATESANTASGKFRVWQIQMQELKETLGASLIPVVTELGKVLQKVTAFAADHTTTIKILVGIVAGLAGGIIAANAALKAYEAIQLAVKAATAAWTAAQYLLNAALSLNPIGLVIIAVAGLAAGLVIAYQKSETFRNIVGAAMDTVKDAVAALDKAFDALLTAAKAAFNWVTDNWKVAKFFFGPIALAVTEIVTHFNSIKTAATAAYNWLTTNFKNSEFFFGPIADAVNAIAGAFTATYNAAVTAYNWITKNFKNFGFHSIARAVQAIADAFNNVVGAIQDVIHWLGKIDFGLLGKVGGIIGKIPHLAPPPAPAPLGRGRSAATPAGVTINVYGAVDPEGTARAINRLLTQHARRIGQAP